MDGLISYYYRREHPSCTEVWMKGVYEDVSRKAFSDKIRKASQALYFDMDHEGDLDILLSREGFNMLLRNNGDGTFSDFTATAGIEGEEQGSREACFGDYDDDGDIDLFMVNRSGSCQLFSNIREGKFRDVSSESGVANIRGATNVATADLTMTATWIFLWVDQLRKAGLFS